MSAQPGAATNGPDALTIYVAEHCMNCAYAYEVADVIRQTYPDVELSIVDVAQPEAQVPEVVFATPTYLLNGRVWSLGNPSWEKIKETFGADSVVVERQE